MINPPDTILFQSRASKRIQAAIDQILEQVESEAIDAYGGRIVRFTYLSYHTDGPTSIEAPITRVFFDQGDEGGPYHMLFEVVARHPYNGRDTAITLTPGGFEFV